MGSKRAQEYRDCGIKNMIPTHSIICLSPQLTLTDNLMNQGSIKIRFVCMIFENLTWSGQKMTSLVRSFLQSCKIGWRLCRTVAEKVGAYARFWLGVIMHAWHVVQTYFFLHISTWLAYFIDWLVNRTNCTCLMSTPKVTFWRQMWGCWSSLSSF